MAPRRVEALARYGLWILTALLPLVAWQVFTANGTISPLVLPPPGDVWDEFVTLVGDTETYASLRVTLSSVAVAAGLALGAGLVLGAAGGMSRFIGELIEPLLGAASAIPIVMAYPLCVFIFGIDETSKIAFAALYGFFPVAITTLHAIRNVDAKLVIMARSMGASPIQMARKVLVPAAGPAIKVGAGMAIVLAYLAVVAGEMLTSRAGAGNELVTALDSYRRAEGYAWIALIILIPMAARGAAWALARADLSHRRRHVNLTKYAATTTTTPSSTHPGRMVPV